MPDIKAVSVKSENPKCIVIKERCPQNHPCPSVRVCPADALSQKGYNAPVVDQDKCIVCGKCVKYCPRGALALQ